MPVEKLGGREAWAIASANPTARCPRPGRDGERLRPLARPEARPRFTFAPDAKVFTIGSCFARNVERALLSVGFEVL